MITPKWLSWGDQSDSFGTSRTFPACFRRKSWWDFLFRFDLVKEQIVLSMYTLTRIHQHNWSKWRNNFLKKKERNEIMKKKNIATRQIRGYRPSYQHSTDWTEAVLGLQLFRQRHTWLSTCSDALMWTVKIHFKQEKGFMLHTDTGVCFVFLLHYPDSSFQHNAFQN